MSSPTPEAIEECLPGLAEAAECLRRTESGEGAGDGGILFELHALRRELAGAKKLIERGAAFYQGWANVLGAASAGYTPSGEAAAIPAAQKISIRG